MYFAPNHSGPLGGGYEICVCGKQMHDFSDYNADFFKNEYEMIFSVFKHGSVEVELFPFERKTYFVIKREKGNERWIGYMDDSGVIKFQKVKRGIKSIIASNGTLYLEFKNGYYKV